MALAFHLIFRPCKEGSEMVIELHGVRVLLQQFLNEVLLIFRPRKEGSEMDIELHGVCVLLLRQFLNDVLQYFLSGQYGLGRLVQQLNEKSVFNV
jgi:hypothetical protein